MKSKTDMIGSLYPDMNEETVDLEDIEDVGSELRERLPEDAVIIQGGGVVLPDGTSTTVSEVLDE